MENNFFKLFKNPFSNGRVFCLCSLILAINAVAQPQLKFTDTKKKFGFVKKGEYINIAFTYKNIGNQPLMITDAKAECSCTTIDYSKQPLAPNQTATITVYFDTKSVYDRQDRVVEITSNAKNPYQKLRFKGVVLK